MTYDANGGKFGSGDTSKVETISTTGNHSLKYTSDYIPTYTNDEGKALIFLGWSAEQLGVLGSTANAAESASKIITSVNVPETGATAYAVWGLDKDSNSVPDVFEATVTYAIENGYWFDSNNVTEISAPIRKTFTLYTKNNNQQWVTTNATLGNTIPTGHVGDAGYTADGWYKDTTKTAISSDTPVTGDVTYTFKYVPVSQPTTYTVVLHLEGGAYTAVPSGYTTSTDGVYQYTVATTDVIKPDTTTLNKEGYAFQGWSLSKTAPQTLIGEDETFAELSIQQNIKTGNYEQIDLYAVWANVAVSKKVETVGGVPFNKDTTVAHVGDKIVWSITVTNEKDTPATVTLTDTMVNAVYTDDSCATGATNVNWSADTHTWTATVAAKGTTTYYVNYTVTQEDIYKGKVINTVTSDTGSTVTSDPVSTWDTKQLKSATRLTKGSDGNWTTTVTLTLPTVSNAEVKPDARTNGAAEPEDTTPNAIQSGSYVIDEIGKDFTFVSDSQLTLTFGDDTCYAQGVRDPASDAITYTFTSAENTVTYTPETASAPAQLKWETHQNIPAGTKVTLSYKLKLTSPNTAAGTYGQTDLNGDALIDNTQMAVDSDKALYTNKSAALYIDEEEEPVALAVFPRPSVSYTVQGSSGGHSSSSRPTLNTKDHYGFVVGYPDGTVQPEGKITRAEVATIYFRMLTDESRTKFWSQSNAYSDVKAGDWFNNAVSTLSNAGIISGYEDGTFRPNGYITRAEFATIAARFFDAAYSGEDLFPDISGHWAKDYINQAANKGFVNGYEDGTFKPNQNITRAEAVTLVNRTLDRHPDKSHFTKDMLTWPDNQDETKWYYADMQEATNSHTYESKENSDKSKYENWTKTLSIRNWEALEKEWSNANSSQGTGNVV